MDKVFEKITLYDILGYVFPGFFLVIVLFIDIFSLMPNKTVQVIEALQDHDALLIMCMVVVSHIVGTTLSQICESSFLSQRIYRVQIEKKKTHNSRLILKLNKHVNSNDVVKALVKSGTSYRVVNKEAVDYIYSEIQTDANYNRIHGYASSELLSRNSSLACLIGAIITFITMILKAGINIINKSSLKHSLFFLVLYLIIILSLSTGFNYLRKRSEAFADKKIFYAVNWFISKYSNGNLSDASKKENK